MLATVCHCITTQKVILSKCQLVRNQCIFFVCSRMQVFSEGYIQSVIYPGKVKLVCLAPLTNIALTMKTYAHFASSLKDIYVMGGNSTGKILLNNECVVISYV